MLDNFCVEMVPLLFALTVYSVNTHIKPHFYLGRIEYLDKYHCKSPWSTQPHPLEAQIHPRLISNTHSLGRTEPARTTARNRSIAASVRSRGPRSSELARARFDGCGPNDFGGRARWHFNQMCCWGLLWIKRKSDCLKLVLRARVSAVCVPTFLFEEIGRRGTCGLCNMGL
jgi:hypothetical protein